MMESSSGENSSVESRHSLDLLRKLANNLETEDLGLQLFQLTTTTTKSNTNIQVQMKPNRMDYQTNDNVCNTTALTVYAPIKYLAEREHASASPMTKHCTP